MLEQTLFINALLSGLLLGGFYASVSIGLTLAFGRLNIVNIAHPAFVIIGSYMAFSYYIDLIWPLRIIWMGLYT